MISQNLIRNVFAPMQGENVLILTDGQQLQKSLVDAFKAGFSKLGFECDVIKFRATGNHSAPLPAELEPVLDKLGKKDIVLAITRYSASGPLFSRMGQGFRAASMPNAFLEMESFDADYAKVARKSHKLQHILNKASMAHIDFSTGHELQLDLRVHRAKADDGDCTKPGQSINLPSGEAYIVPYEGPGSKSSGVWPMMHEGKLVELRVFENTITDIRGSTELEKRFNQDAMRRNVAELGLGCNDKARVIGNILQDEKVEGLHLAYGMSSHLGGEITPEMFKHGAVHQDIVYAKGLPIFTKKVSLDIDGGEKTIIKDGKYVIFR